jgi:DNA-binding NarL/FixJ family response regulator
MLEHRIRVFLTDDNLIVREVVSALLRMAPDIEVAGVVGDYEGPGRGAKSAAPQAVVMHIRMPPTFRRAPSRRPSRPASGTWGDPQRAYLPGAWSTG